MSELTPLLPVIWQARAIQVSYYSFSTRAQLMPHMACGSMWMVNGNLSTKFWIRADSPYSSSGHRVCM